MTRDEIKDLILEIIEDIDEDAEFDDLDADAPLRDQLDLDSMDYLTWMLGINKETGIEIPERDYPKLMTLNGAVEYLMGAA